MKRALASITFGIGCIAGFVATAYGVTTAFLMGSQAQADIDETTPADPRLLVRSTVQRLMQMTQATGPSTIELEDDAVEINPME